MASNRVKSAVDNEELTCKLISKAFVYGISFSLDHITRTCRMTTRPINGRIRIFEVPLSASASEALLAFINELELDLKHENQRKPNLP